MANTTTTTASATATTAKTKQLPRDKILVNAPAGSLGLKIMEPLAHTDRCIIVDHVDPKSSLFTKVQKGDWIEKLDDQDIRGMKLPDIVKWFKETENNTERRLGILRLSATTATAITSPRSPSQPLTEQEKRVHSRARAFALMSAPKPKATGPGAAAAAARKSARQQQKEAARAATAKRRREEALAAANAQKKKKQKRVKKTFAVMSCQVDDPLLPVALRDLPKHPLTIFVNRPEVKEELVRAHELHKGADTLEALLSQGSVTDTNNPELVRQMKNTIQTMRRERDLILDVDDAKLTLFEKKLKALVKFCNEHGHAHVKERNVKDRSLNNFVYNQRVRRRNAPADIKANDSMERIEEDIVLLDRLGFVWNPDKHAGTSWDDYLELLVAYKEEFGHVKVPQLFAVNGLKLGQWVSNQRKDYEKLKENKTTPLTQERKEKLENIGFVWKLRFGRPKKSDPRYRNKRYRPVTPQSPEQQRRRLQSESGGSNNSDDDDDDDDDDDNDNDEEKKHANHENEDDNNHNYGNNAKLSSLADVSQILDMNDLSE